MSDTEPQVTRLVPDVDPEATAVTTAERSFTWDELEQRACRLANALDEAGIGGGGGRAGAAPTGR